MSIQFMSLASGSSGNCYYVSTREGAILIDAGIATRTIRKHLANNRLPMEHIHAVLVTHDHADHIKGLPAMPLQPHTVASLKTIAHGKSR